MHLKKLSLVNFKNYSEAEMELDAGVNAFVGGNGEGKTNLLDAIHYLSLCKSYFNPVDSQNIRHENEFFFVQGIFDLGSVEENISCSLKRGQKKVFKRNQKEYERLSGHIGLLPVVMISPTDSNLITGGSEERRRFTDSIISQFDGNYLGQLIAYSNVLVQRNAYLKQSARSGVFDYEIVQLWDMQLVRSGTIIHSVRKKFIDEIAPVFNEYYAYISGGKETVGIQYDSHLNVNDFSLALEESQSRDKILQYTSVGPHKDDLIFSINGFPVKRFASQGQQKSFLISLKLAQFEFISRKKGLKPVLLLDDIFDKLDDERVSKLMDLVSRDNFGQIFITDTHPERLITIFQEMNVPIRVIPVRDGNVNEKINQNLPSTKPKHMRRSNDQTLKEAIESMLKTYKLDAKMQQLKLINSWEKVMGPAVASRTTDIKFYGNKLYVTLSSASLRQELFQERDKLVKLLNEESGVVVVTEIIFS